MSTRSRLRRALTAGVAGAALCLATAAGTAQAATRHAPSPIDLGSFGGSTFVNGINDRGQTVGYGFFAGPAYHYHAFLWQNGQLRDLGSLAGPDGNSTATAIDNAGEAVGFTDSPAGGQVPFVYRHGQMTQLGSDGIPLAINNSGRIVGYTGGSGGFTPVVWRHGTAVPLPAPASCPYARAIAINDEGQILGDCANIGSTRTLLWQGDYRRVKDLGSVLNGVAINDRGWIVGQDTVTKQAALRSPKGMLKDLGTAPGYPVSSFARSVNEDGQIAGDGTSATGSAVFRLDHGVFSVLPSPAGTTNATASWINERGQIVGTVRDSAFVAHAILWR